jgi:ABC-type transport system involved in multi-copper enzyme maturation permease subunit
MNIVEFDEMGISSESYAYQYQLKVIDLYKNAQSDIKIGFEYTRGWGDYFNYDIVNIFIFAILIMFGSAVFAQEQNNGFMAIIRTSKNGRAKTAFAKIGAMLILTFAVVLAFTFSTMAVFGAVLGFSSTNNAIQVFSDFLLSPAVVTVGQYLFITVAVNFFVFALFSCVILTISVFIYNYAIIYICGFGLFGLNFLLYTMSFINADNPLRNLNFVAVAAVNPLFIRYRSLNFFGDVAGYISVLFAVFGVLLIISSTITVLVFSNGQAGITAGRVFKISNIFCKIKTLFGHIGEKIPSILPQRQAYSFSIFAAETYKTLILKRFIFVVIGLLAVKCYISNGEFTAVRSYSDAVYKEYMTTLSGEFTDEKRNFLADERAYIDDILLKKDEVFEKYFAEEISFDEYREYLTDYNYAYSRSELFKRIEEHAQYIDQTAAQKNISAWFIYDTGWNKLLHRNFDIILYVLILLLFSGIFADEHTSKSSSGSFAQILRTAKNGRKRTFTSKLISALAITALLTIAFNVIDFIILLKNYDLPALNAPLVSMQSFAAINGGFTIMQYLAVYFLTRLFAYLLFAAFVCGLSELLKKTVFVMSVSVALTLFPALFAYFGLGAFSYFDFTALLSATQIYLLSARTGLLGDTGLFILFTVCCALISCGTLLKSNKDYVK